METILAFYASILNDVPRPKFSWELVDNGNIKVRSETKVEKVLMWTATNETSRDFRKDIIGNSWKSISNNLPKRGSVYSIEEDHVDKSLIFCGTEFGVFFSPNKGERWKKLGNGLPVSYTHLTLPTKA